MIDGLQWADEDSLELLALLVERVAGRSRWSRRGRSPAPPEAHRALVERLARGHARRRAGDDRGRSRGLIADLAPHVPSERLRAAAALATGSPYLAELIGREVSEADPDEAEALFAWARCRAAAAAARRTARLSCAGSTGSISDERALAEIAALAGGAVTFEQLRDVANPSTQVQPALRGLLDERILRATPSSAGIGLRLLSPAPARRGARVDRRAHAAGAPPPVRRVVRAPRRRPRPARVPRGTRASSSRRRRGALQAAQAARRSSRGASPPTGTARRSSWAPAIRSMRGRAGPRCCSSAASSPRPPRVPRAGADRGAGGELAADRWRVRAAEALLKLGEIQRGLGVLDGVLERRGQRRSRIRAVSVVRAAAVAARWLSPLPARPAPDDEVLAAAYRGSRASCPRPTRSRRSSTCCAGSRSPSAPATAPPTPRAWRCSPRTSPRARSAGSAIARSPPPTRLAQDAPYPCMVAAGCAGIIAMLRGDWSGMRAAHEDGERICRRLGLERVVEASFLRSYWALGEHYAGEPGRALVLIDELTGSADDMFSRAMLGSYRGRAPRRGGRPVRGPDARGASSRPRRPARHGMASIYRQVFAAELALGRARRGRRGRAGRRARRHRPRAVAVGRCRRSRLVVEVIAATADLGLAAAGDRAAAARAAATAAPRVPPRPGVVLRGDRAAAVGPGRGAPRPPRPAPSVSWRARPPRRRVRGGKVDRLALAALSGDP